MMLFTLILSCVVAGSLACSYERCSDFDSTRQLYETKFLPNRTQLKNLCPKVINYLECQKTSMECHGQSLDELAVSSDRAVSNVALTLLDGLSLIRELCDEESNLQHDYLESVECVRGNIGDIGRMCEVVAYKQTEDFFKQLYPEERDYFNHYSQITCFKDAFHTACMADKIGDTCGNVAERTAEYGLERMKEVFKANRCGGEESSDELKARYFNSLEIDESKRSTIRRYFEYFTKK